MKTVDELSQNVPHLFRLNVDNIFGGYMAGRIEDQLGREALVDTAKIDPIAFIETYNSVAEEGMELNFVGPANGSISMYHDLRSFSLLRRDWQYQK